MSHNLCATLKFTQSFIQNELFLTFILGNVWWHDGWDKQLEDTPYYIADENTPTNTKACGDLGMIMRGIEVDNSIAIYASPDYIHTKDSVKKTSHFCQ